MASRIVEDEDLIDLDDGGVVPCVSRLTNVPEASHEELEHLLDVCPPKLEQKLSLTRREEATHENTKNDDILVTLGHDKVVPRRKRIDVVSSETIKRIRDITKNLEPVIRNSTNSRLGEQLIRENGVDSIDGMEIKNFTAQENSTNDRRQDVNYETQAINSAFDFLSELDDDDDDEDDDQPPDKKRRISGHYECKQDPKPPSCYPLEPTCLIEDKTTNYRDIDRANRAIEANDRTSVIEYDNDTFNDDIHENLGFEISPLSKKVQQETSEENTRNFYETRSMRLRNDDKGSRRVKRKSWSEGETRGLVSDNDKKRRDDFPRSGSIVIDRFDEPSTSNGITTLLRRSSRYIVSRVPEHSASSSECSEVDWSWVEEYETPSTISYQIRISPSSSFSAVSGIEKIDKIVNSQYNSNTINGTIPRNSVRTNGRPVSAPTKLPTSATVLIDSEDDGAASVADYGEITKQREAGWEVSGARDSNGSVAMSADRTGKETRTTASTVAPLSLTNDDFSTSNDITNNVSTNFNRFNALSCDRETTNERIIVNDDSCNADSNDFIVAEDATRASQRNGNNRVGGTNSWLRASMRRLRHLRLPDNEINLERRNVVDTTTITNSCPPINERNSLPDIALVAPEVLAAHTNSGNTGNSTRPSSAPVTTRDNSFGCNTNGRTITIPRRGRRHENRQRIARSQEREIRDDNGTSNGGNGSAGNGENTEISVESGATTTTSPRERRVNAGASQHATTTTNTGATRRNCERQREVDRDNERGDDEDDEDENPLGRWPHALSPALACLGCTLGLFNISRFAILSIQFGANFIVQFLVLSLVLGIPLLTLQVCLGQRLAAGAVDMWRISPIFHGVGIALLVAQAFIGIYSIIGVSWMFVYFRDSFITKQDRYRWAEPFLLYRDDTRMLHNASTYKLHETVPDYFSGVVLQRHHINEPEPGVVTLKFQVAFNLAVVWMIVFVSLSKGLRSYGKVVYVFTLVPVFGTLILCTKLLGLTPPGSIHQLFPATVWNEFFINSRSWVAASSEVFLTWGLLGAAAMQVAAHNKHKHLLQRDTSLVVVLTLVVLLLSAFLANTCVQILRHYGYTYTTSTFEKISGYTFMRHVNQPPPSGYSNTPERFMSHGSFLLGQRVVRPGADLGTESGYQALRLSTELVPATLAILGTEQVSPFWAVLFYFILILFGIAQQLAIWHCVITGIMAINTKMMKLWETTITFFSCACAYILGLPMATELGIYVVYYLDYTVGGAWWIIILYLVQVGAVFAVRGRPHTGETVVAELFPPTGRCLRHWAGPLLSFTWNVVLPVALMVLSITIFKSSSYRDLYVYRRTSRDYWSVWTRQLGAAIQLTPILIIPGVAIIQTCRYLNSGPPDIFDRIQLLYRPPLVTDDPTSLSTNYTSETNTSIHGNGILPTTNEPPFEDPPPKYTPPPSYTTATGARIAKMLRQSFRRSVRRLANVLGETSAPRTRTALQPPPPDYATVLVEMNQSDVSENIDIHEPRTDITEGRSSVIAARDIERNRPNTIDRTTRISTIDRSAIERTHSTMDRARGRIYNIGSSNLTAADVANLLRSSIRRGATHTQHNLCRNSLDSPDSTETTESTVTTTAASVENLVNAAVPINEDSHVYDKDVPLVHDEREHDDDDDDEKKTVNETDNSASVI